MIHEINLHIHALQPRLRFCKLFRRGIKSGSHITRHMRLSVVITESSHGLSRRETNRTQNI